MLPAGANWVRAADEAHPRRLTSMGRTIKYVVTDRCNGTCSYCFIRGRLAYSSLSVEDVLRSFDVLWPAFGNRFDCIHFFGGEPSLRMDLLELVTQSALQRYPSNSDSFPTVLISTNCLQLSEPLLRYLIHHRQRVLLITSIDGPSWLHDWGRGVGSFSRVAETVARLRSEGIQIYNVTAVYGYRALREGLSPYAIACQLVDQFQPVSITFNLLHTTQRDELLEPGIFYDQLLRSYQAAIEDFHSADEQRRKAAEAFLHIDLSSIGGRSAYFCDFGIDSIAVFPGGLVDVCSDVPLFGIAPRACVHDAEFARQLAELRERAKQRNAKTSVASCRGCPAIGCCHMCTFWSPQRRAAHCEFVRRKHALLTGKHGDEVILPAACDP
jgi:sulfatase maturation enzyme AslB (radical SAM superfamily)